jgi:iron complex outermembrane receptor protein
MLAAKKNAGGYKMAKFAYGVSLIALIFSSAAAAQTPTEAPQPPREDPPVQTARIVVTGSFLGSSLETQAQPVDTVSLEDLRDSGNPSLMQFVKTVPGAGSSPGEQNRFDPGVTGFSLINMRGLGPGRTLVLMNGQRLVQSPSRPAFLGPGNDLNFVPTNALSRVDVLKDGAAATYGSEAIGGVVNFVTRRDLDGLQVEAENASIQGSDGNRLFTAAFGEQFDSGNLLLAGSYREQSGMLAGERDWALRDFSSSNGTSGWSGNGNPGNYQDPVSGAYIFRDNGCQELGGVLTRSATLNGVGSAVPVNPLLPETGTAATSCRIQFSPYNYIVSPTETYNLYAEFNTAVSDTVDFHAEAGWLKNSIFEQKSPSNGFSVFPTPISLGGTSGSLRPPDTRLFVPLNIPNRNPGLQDLYTTCAAPLTAAQCALMAGPNGVDASQGAFRPIFFSVAPGQPRARDSVTYDVTSWRVSGGLNWVLPFGIEMQPNLTYMSSSRVIHNSEVIPTLVQLAVNGYGSLGSDPSSCAPSERTLANAGNNAVGCYYFNPFTSAIAVSGITGKANPYYRGAANATVRNNEDVLDGMFRSFSSNLTNEIFVGDLVLTGSFGTFKLPGGEPEWAVGGQLREETYVEIYTGVQSLDAFPYSDSVDDGTPVGPFRTGSSAGAPALPNFELSRRINALFGELKLPILDNLEANFAIRTEDYEGIGRTTNPRVSVRWQPVDWLTLRGSAGSTFRAPLATDGATRCLNTTLNILGAFRPVDICGNPDIQPETANTYNFGAIFDGGGFRASVDYYRINFMGQLTSESGGSLVNAMFPGGSSARCGDPQFAALQARFTFIGGVCAPANYLGLKSFIVNGPDTDTDGIDFSASYGFDDFLISGSNWDVGVAGSYLLSYDKGPFKLLGASSVVFQNAAKLAGTHNFNEFNVYSKLRLNSYVNYQSGPLGLRWQMTYHEGTEGAVGTSLFRQIPDQTQPSGARLLLIGKLDPEIRHDFIASYETGWGSTLSLSVLNVLDSDPPFAPSILGFDVTKADPLGRVVKLNLRHSF